MSDTLPATRHEAIISNSIHYFTGKPCKNGHVSARTIARNCIACLAANNQKWYRANREKADQRHQKWHDDHPGSRAAFVRESRLKHLEKRREEGRLAQERRRKENPEREREIYKRAYRNNPKRVLLNNIVRSKRVRQATPSWADLDAIRSFAAACPPGLHVDHIVPIKGKNVCGLHVLWNLQYLTSAENLTKGNRLSSQIIFHHAITKTRV